MRAMCIDIVQYSPPDACHHSDLDPSIRALIFSNIGARHLEELPILQVLTAPAEQRPCDFNSWSTWLLERRYCSLGGTHNLQRHIDSSHDQAWSLFRFSALTRRALTQ